MNDEPAFPIHGGLHENQFNGMGLRDYFAAKAMQGVFTNPIPCSDDERRYIAEKSYKMADAMLKARAA